MISRRQLLLGISAAAVGAKLPNKEVIDISQLRPAFSSYTFKGLDVGTNDSLTAIVRMVYGADKKHYLVLDVWSKEYVEWNTLMSTEMHDLEDSLKDITPGHLLRDKT